MALCGIPCGFVWMCVLSVRASPCLKRYLFQSPDLEFLGDVSTAGGLDSVCVCVCVWVCVCVCVCAGLTLAKSTGGRGLMH